MTWWTRTTGTSRPRAGRGGSRRRDEHLGDLLLFEGGALAERIAAPRLRTSCSGEQLEDPDARFELQIALRHRSPRAG